MSNDKQQQDLATQIKNHRRSGEFDKALEISKGALKSDPPDLEAYNARWRLIAEKSEPSRNLFSLIKRLLAIQLWEFKYHRRTTLNLDD